MPFYIIAKVKRKSLPGSLNFYLKQCGYHSSYREWNEHNLLYPLTKQSWGMIRGTVTVYMHSTDVHVTTSCSCHCKLEQEGGLGCLFPNTWFIRIQISHKDAWLPLCFCDVHHGGPQECLEGLSFFFFFLKENHRCWRKWLPGLWGLSWWGAADKLRTSQGKK